MSALYVLLKPCQFIWRPGDWISYTVTIFSIKLLVVLIWKRLNWNMAAPWRNVLDFLWRQCCILSLTSLLCPHLIFPHTFRRELALATFCPTLFEKDRSYISCQENIKDWNGTMGNAMACVLLQDDDQLHGAPFFAHRPSWHSWRHAPLRHYFKKISHDAMDRMQPYMKNWNETIGNAMAYVLQDNNNNKSNPGNITGAARDPYWRISFTSCEGIHVVNALLNIMELSHFVRKTANWTYY